MEFKNAGPLVAAFVCAAVVLPAAKDFQFSKIRLRADRSTYAGSCPVTINFFVEFDSDSEGIAMCKFVENGSEANRRTDYCSLRQGLNTFSVSRTVGRPGTNFNGWEEFEVSGGSKTSRSNRVPIVVTCK